MQTCKLTGKTALLLFFFIIFNPLFAEPLPEPEPDLITEEQADEDSEPEEWIFFLEELFISYEELLTDEENFFNAEIIIDEECEEILTEEFQIEEEILLADNDDIDKDTEEEQQLEDEILLADNDDTDEEDSYDEYDDFEYLTSLLFEGAPVIYEVPEFEPRSFFDVFPNLTARQRRLAMSTQGARNYFTKNESSDIIPNPELEIDLLSKVMEGNPSHLIDALVLVPYKEKEYDLLDLYNAIGRIEKIKDQSVILNGSDFYIFSESTRIQSARNRRAIPDPEPATTLPFSETMYIRLKEISLGNLFLRGEVSLSIYGLTYTMTNFVDVRYFIVPIVRSGRFITTLYLEPVIEGVLIYSMTGFYMPDFIADKVNLTPNINRRIQIFINWITEGLRESVAGL